MSKHLNEIELIEGLKTADDRFFDQVFEFFHPQMQYFAERLIDNREEAEDIVIQVFQKFWNIKENFNSIANIRAFLYITTRNNCLNYLRYRQSQQEGRKEYESVLLTAPEVKNAERKVIETDLMQSIYRKVQEMPERMREIFLLTYFEGLKAPEIAERLKISVSTVTTQRSRAVQLLKKAFTEENLATLGIILLEIFHNT